MVDRYTKVVLTVIAAALVALTLIQLTPRAIAQASGLCGYDSRHACYVTASEPLNVEVKVEKYDEIPVKIVMRDRDDPVPVRVIP
jgi:hypothetical protein